MNLEKVFSFIKEKKGYDYPVKYKLINGIPLSEDELNVKGYLDLTGTDLKTLPDNLTVGGDLMLSFSSILSLPNNLTVGGNIYASNTSLHDMPNNLKIGGGLRVYTTPISTKYSDVEIRKMIENKGGYVRRGVNKFINKFI